MARLYTINHNSFSSVQTESQAYCLGFLLADGWVISGNKGVSVAIHESDISVLDYLRNSCGSNAPFYRKSRKEGFNPGGALVGLNLCSVRMASDLAGLGLVRNKSISTNLPNLRSNLTRHLLRGLFDGDGSIGSRQFWLTGSKDILTDVVVASRGICPTLAIGTTNGYPRLWGGRKNANFLHWIYADCDFALPRKLAIYREHWKRSGARERIILSSPPSR